MESINGDRAAKVWQRVRGGTPEQPDPGRLLYAEAEAEAAYRTLAERLPRHAPDLNRMAEQAHRRGHCLRGICRWREDRLRPAIPMRRPEGEISRILQKCYTRCLRCAALCGSMREDPEFGCAYSAMETEHRQNACRILELLGMDKL